MKRNLTGQMRVCSDELDKLHAQHRSAALREAKRVAEASRLLRRASAEIAALQRQVEGSRAYAQMLEKRLGIAV